MCVCLYVGMCSWVCVSAEIRGIRSPRAGDGCESPDMSAGNQTQGLWKSCKFM